MHFHDLVPIKHLVLECKISQIKRLKQNQNTSPKDTQILVYVVIEYNDYKSDRATQH